jgi:hypothetical protein
MAHPVHFLTDSSNNRTSLVDFLKRAPVSSELKSGLGPDQLLSGRMKSDHYTTHKLHYLNMQISMYSKYAMLLPNKFNP